MTKNIVSQKSKKSKHAIVGIPMHTERGKVIGQVIADVFVKDINNGHILDKFNAIASDICTLHEAEDAGATWVEFENIDTGVIYRAPISRFWEHGFYIDFGFGEQQALNLSHFEHKRNTPTTPPTPTITHTEPPKQLRMFGGGNYA
jgi:hypothetical protein